MIAPLPGSDHASRDRLGDRDRGTDIEVDQRIDRGVGRLEEGLADVGSGVVEQDVEWPLGVDKGAHGGAVGRIEGARPRREPLRREPLDRRLHLGQGAGGQ